MGKFTNLTVDYKSLMKLSVSDRASMTKSSTGQQLLSSMTPEQLASMFPDYYKEKLPDVGNILKSLANPKAAQGGETGDLHYRRKNSRAREEVKPGWLRKLEDQTGVTISEPGAKAQLDSEKKEVVDLLKKGKVSIDDPRAGFLKDLSPEDLKSAGIQRETDKDGKVSFAALPTASSTMSDEDVIKKHSESTFEGSFKNKASKLTSDLMRDLGLTREQAAGLVGNLAHESAGLNTNMEEQGFNRHGTKGFGLAQWTDTAPGRGRRTDLVNFAKQNGLDPNSYEAQYKFMVQEFKTTEAPALAALKSARTVEEATQAALKYERPDIAKANVGSRQNYALKAYKETEGITGEEYLPKNATPAQIAEYRKKMDEKEYIAREQKLAAATLPALPDGLDSKVVEYYNGLSSGQKQKFQKMLSRAGEGEQDPTASGVAKVNEIYKLQPSLVNEEILNGRGKIQFMDNSVGQRSAQMTEDTQDKLNRFSKFAPPGTVVNSTFRDRNHPNERDKDKPGMHTQGRAIDVGTNGKSPEELAAIIQSLKKSGFNHVLLEGNPPHIHAENREGQNEFTISNLGNGHPNISLEQAREAAKQAKFNEALPEEPKKEAEDKKSIPPPESPDLKQAKAEPVKNSTDVEKKPDPVEVLAEGGAKQVNVGEIKALPIGGTKGDNSVVVDENSNPLFTMNTNKESAQYNPHTGKVSVEPVTKTDPAKLETQPVDVLDRSQRDEPEPKPQTTAQAQQMPLPRLPSASSHDTALTMTQSIFKDPSFERAVARTRFQNSGDDALGGHFDQGSF